MIEFKQEKFASSLAEQMARNLINLQSRLGKLYIAHVGGANLKRYKEVLKNIESAIEREPAFREDYDLITLISYLDCVSEVFQNEDASAKEKIGFRYLFVAMTSLSAACILGRKGDYFNFLIAYGDAHHYAGAAALIEDSIPELVEQNGEIIARLLGSKGGSVKAKKNDEPREKIFIEFCKLGRKFHSDLQAIREFQAFFMTERGPRILGFRLGHGY